MSQESLIRAWKDHAYRASLGAEGEAIENPAGTVELPDELLEEVAGGRTERMLTMGCCGGLTSDPGYCSLFCGSADCGTGTYSCSCGPSCAVCVMETEA